MKILNLIIKQKYFDAIMEGRKVQEFREIRPTTYKKLCETDQDEDGTFIKQDEHGTPIPQKYDAIRFYVGYNTDRDSALVEIKNANVEFFVDDNNELITYDVDGNMWYATQVVYDLGRIIETNIHPKSRR